MHATYKSRLYSLFYESRFLSEEMSKEQQKQFLIFYSTVQHSTVQCNATHHEALPGLAAGAGGRDGRHPGGVIGGDQKI